MPQPVARRARPRSPRTRPPRPRSRASQASARAARRRRAIHSSVVSGHQPQPLRAGALRMSSPNTSCDELRDGGQQRAGCTPSWPAVSAASSRSRPPEPPLGAAAPAPARDAAARRRPPRAALARRPARRAGSAISPSRPPPAGLHVHAADAEQPLERPVHGVDGLDAAERDVGLLARERRRCGSRIASSRDRPARRQPARRRPAAAAISRAEQRRRRARATSGSPPPPPRRAPRPAKATHERQREVRAARRRRARRSPAGCRRRGAMSPSELIGACGPARRSGRARAPASATVSAGISFAPGRGVERRPWRARAPAASRSRRVSTCCTRSIGTSVRVTAKVPWRMSISCSRTSQRQRRQRSSGTSTTANSGEQREGDPGEQRPDVPPAITCTRIAGTSATSVPTPPSSRHSVRAAGARVCDGSGVAVAATIAPHGS